jgi:hypothetical protein
VVEIPADLPIRPAAGPGSHLLAGAQIDEPLEVWF